MSLNCNQLIVLGEIYRGGPFDPKAEHQMPGVFTDLDFLRRCELIIWDPADQRCDSEVAINYFTTEYGDKYMRLALDHDKVVSHEQLFEMHDRNAKRAINIWRKDTGRNLVVPDHTDLLIWLLKRLDGVCTGIEDMLKMDDSKEFHEDLQILLDAYQPGEKLKASDEAEEAMKNLVMVFLALPQDDRRALMAKMGKKDQRSFQRVLKDLEKAMTRP